MVLTASLCILSGLLYFVYVASLLIKVHLFNRCVCVCMYILNYEARLYMFTASGY